MKPLVLAMPLFVIALGLNVALADDAPKQGTAAELKRLDGEWKIVAAELGGEAIDTDDLVVFRGGKCTVTNAKSGITFENTVLVDPSKSPRRIEVTNTRTGQVWAGIYELKDNRLRCLFYGNKDAQAPLEFKTARGSQQVMYTYERVKPK